jgi:hypothetical protein
MDLVEYRRRWTALICAGVATLHVLYSNQEISESESSSETSLSDAGKLATAKPARVRRHYKDLFGLRKAGSNTETGDAGDDPRPDTPDFSEDESEDDGQSYDGDESGDDADDDNVVGSPTPVSRQDVTAARKRKLETDSDHTPAPSAKKRRLRKRDSTICADI